MSTGRSFPLRSPYRSFPYDPQENGDTDRTFYIPFQNLQNIIYGWYRVGQILQILVTKVSISGGGVSIPGCSPVPNQFCVPMATITVAARPVATIRCAIL